MAATGQHPNAWYRRPTHKSSDPDTFLLSQIIDAVTGRVQHLPAGEHD
jgi:hypothetical protein